MTVYGWYLAWYAEAGTQTGVGAGSQSGAGLVARLGLEANLGHKDGTSTLVGGMHLCSVAGSAHYMLELLLLQIKLHCSGENHP